VAPAGDPIAFTTEGRAWVDHEWLFQVILAALVSAGGLRAAWLLKQACILLAAVLPAAWLLRRRVPPLPVALLATVALAGARFRFFVRPELAGLVLVPVVLILLETARAAAHRGRRPWPALLPLPFLVVLWVNLHPSALLGAGVVGLYAICRALEERGPSGSAGLFLLSAAACGAALLANPYGSRVLEVPLEIRSALSGDLMVNPEWGTPLRWEFWHFWLVLAALGAAGALARRRRLPLSPPLVICGVALAAVAAATLRFVGLFYMALPVVAGGALGAEGWRRLNSSAGTRLAGAAAVGLPPLAAALFLVFPAGAPPGAGLAAGRYPEAMAATYKDAGFRGPFYNPVRFGGYLAWRLAPERVFIDGRNELHAPLLSRMAACRAATDLDCWDELMNRWKIDVAFVDYDPRRVVVRMPGGAEETRTLSSVYFRRELWSLVDWDDVAMLVVRRPGKEGPPLPMPEDRLLMPEDPPRFVRLLEAGRIDPEQALVEVERRLARHPGSLRARFLEEEIRRALSRPTGKRLPAAGTDRGPGKSRSPAGGEAGGHDSQRPSE
jgi:hypothetical protein